MATTGKSEKVDKNTVYIKLDSGAKFTVEYDPLTKVMTTTRPNWELLDTGLPEFKAKHPKAQSVSFGWPSRMWSKGKVGAIGLVVTLSDEDYAVATLGGDHWPKTYLAKDGSEVPVYLDPQLTVSGW